jgi:ethanolamine utilization protein EutA
VHDGDAEHYHDLGEGVRAADDSIVWTTVGFDIGSSTSQVVFSRITLARQDAYYIIVDRSILHQSEVILTPYRAPTIIDTAQLSDFIDRQFGAAAVERDAVDAGAVILTGLALSSSNARAVAETIADESGRFVAVAAGDVLEARLAASGAGVPAISAQRTGVLVHIDIGGGTTKLSAWREGKLLGVAALDVGARLVTVDADGVVVRLEEPVARVASDLKLDLRVGTILDTAVAERIAGAMARNVLRHAGVLREPPRGQSSLRTGPLFNAGDELPIEAVLFSGGVSEYVYHRETRTFGDLGLLLGRAIRAEVDATGVLLLPFEQGIRATVLGVSQHSVQLSGNTIFVSDSVPLPMRNLPVLLPHLDLGHHDLDGQKVLDRLTEALRMHAGSVGSPPPVIAIRWEGMPNLDRLTLVAQAVAHSVAPHLGDSDPCVVIVEGDVAGVLGAALERAFEGRRGVVCLDGVHVHEFDHVDVGAFTQHVRALPVIVKSLLFASSAQKITHA